MTATPHLTENAPIPAVGQPAPDFTLATTGSKPVTLAELRGQKVLLAFFPLAFTSTCTSELCAFSDDYDEFANAGVRVVPISVDSTASLKEYKAKYGMKADLASDFRRDVSRLYGVLNEERFFSQRSYFLIDADGIVRWVHVETLPGVRRENSEILAEIARLG